MLVSYLLFFDRPIIHYTNRITHSHTASNRLKITQPNQINVRIPHNCISPGKFNWFDSTTIITKLCEVYTCLDEFLSLFSKGNGKSQRKFVVDIACELNEKKLGHWIQAAKMYSCWISGMYIWKWFNVNYLLASYICRITIHISWSIHRLWHHALRTPTVLWPTQKYTTLTDSQFH
jgi:hypothetical protein